jgi:putative flippase GtrA
MGTSWMKLTLDAKEFVLEFLDSKTFIQMVKYVTTGSVAFALYILLIYILTDCIGIWKYVSITVSHLIVFWLIFLLTKYWTFKEKQSNTMKRQLVYYTYLFFVNLFLTYLIVYILTDILGVYYIIPQIICNMILGWNFILYKSYIQVEKFGIYLPD